MTGKEYGNRGKAGLSLSGAYGKSCHLCKYPERRNSAAYSGTQRCFSLPLKYPFFIPRLCTSFPFSFQDIIHKILLLGLLLQKVFQLFPVSSGYPGLSVIIIKIDDLPELFRIGKPVIQLHAVFIRKASFRFISCKNIQAKADRPAVFSRSFLRNRYKSRTGLSSMYFSKLITEKLPLGK